MIDLSVMSDVNKYAPSTGNTMQTMSFGAHRDSDRPASAIAAGASSLPLSWRTASGTSAGKHQHGEPVRSIADIVKDPIRWATSTRQRKLAAALLAVTTLVILIF